MAWLMIGETCLNQGQLLLEVVIIKDGAKVIKGMCVLC
jgi:hypothetical protein